MLSKISWRTSVWGVLGIVGTILTAIYHFHVTGQFDLDGTLKAISAIAVGCGLIAAADNKNLPGGVKALFVVALLALSAHPAVAQTPLQTLVGGGMAYNNAGVPSVAGTAFFAKSINDGTGTYAYTVLDVLPNSFKPLTVNTNISTGVAQKVFSLGKYDIYAPIGAGVSFQGSNLGWAWTGGGLVPVKVKGSLYIVPSLRFAKSSVSNGTGYQLIPGLALAWGK